MEVKVTGVRETLRALKRLDPDLEKQIRKSINASIRDVVNLARGYVPAEQPMSGWKPDSWGHRGWDNREVVFGIKRQNKSRRNRAGGWSYSIEVDNTSAPGMIYELAGSKSNGNTRQGQQFITNIERSGLRRPLRRLVVRAGIEQGPATKRRILMALSVAQAETQRRLDAPHG